MLWMITVLFAVTAFLFFIYCFKVLLLSDRRVNNRVKRYLETGDKKRLDKKLVNLFVQLKVFNQQAKEQVVSEKKNKKLAYKLQRAGVPLKPEEYVIFQWVAAAFIAGFLYFVSTQLIFMALGAIIGFFLPQFWLKRKEKKRMQKFNDNLADMISTIVGSLRAGFSFPQALKTVAEEMDNPMKEEIETVIKEMQYGSTLEDALNDLKARMPSEDLDLMIQAVLIQRQVGGNLATVLDTIVQTIRDRVKIQRQIQTLTAQGRLSGMVIGLLPLALAVIINFIEPGYINVLFEHPFGILMIGAGVISGTLGFVFIRKMTRIEV